MKIVLFIIGAFILIGLYYGISIYLKVQVSKRIVADTHAFQLISNDMSESVLVIGDSTGVGVGATTPEESIAGLFSQQVHATYVENVAVSGAEVRDLDRQLTVIKQKHYSYILVQIGGNDIVAMHDSVAEAKHLSAILAKLPKSDHVIVMSCGNIGTAKLIPWFMRPYYTRLTLAYHAAFSIEVSQAGGTYVNLYDPPQSDLFLQYPEIYLAADDFHPSSAGYALWFEKLKKILPQ
jgi:lysophospholipase L1-like esterase